MIPAWGGPMQKRSKINKKYKITCQICGRSTRRTATYQKYCPKCRDKAYKKGRADWSAKNRAQTTKKQKRANWLRRYSVTLKQYKSMFDNQNGCCAICGKHHTEFDKLLCVDHCHKTGKVRGLLCNGCNLLLGRFENHRKEIERYLDETT